MGRPVEFVVLSGKGGTGKTSITAAFASLADKTVFTDCDVDAADLHLILSPDVYRQEDFASGSKALIDSEKCTNCSLCMDLCRFNAIKTDGSDVVIDEYACDGCGLCALACPENAINIKEYSNNQINFANCRFGTLIYGKLGIAEENSGKLVSKIRQHARETAGILHASYIITDGPPGIGCPAISSVTGADLVVAITEPTLSGWHDLNRLIEMIGRFRTPVYVIINKYDLNEEMSDTIENNLKNKSIDILGKIPYDESMLHALLEGKSICEFMPDGLLSQEIKRMWNALKRKIYEPESI